jgi:hypothetical protein
MERWVLPMTVYKKCLFYKKDGTRIYHVVPTPLPLVYNIPEIDTDMPFACSIEEASPEYVKMHRTYELQMINTDHFFYREID